MHGILGKDAQEHMWVHKSAREGESRIGKEHGVGGTYVTYSGCLYSALLCLYKQKSSV